MVLARQTSLLPSLLTNQIRLNTEVINLTSAHSETQFVPVSVPYDIIQTFYADPDAVGGASTILMTSVDLFVHRKPKSDVNTSGAHAPGIVVTICNVTGGNPDPTKIVAGSTVRLSYNQIYAFSDASVATTFTFPKPISLLTSQFYGIMISFEDSGYACWVNKTGDRIVGTNTPSPGSNNTKDGKYYVTTNSGTYTAINNTDLKYRAKCAQFLANTATVNLVNKNYEFFTIRGRRGFWLGGEFVYQVSANATGTISVTAGNNTILGTNTDFTALAEGNYVVLVHNSNVQIVEISSVTNATYLTTVTTPIFSNTAAVFQIAPVGRVHYSDYTQEKLYLVESNANTTIKFSASGTLLAPLSGANATIYTIDTFDAHRVVPKLRVAASPNTVMGFTYALAANIASVNYIQAEDFLSLNRMNEVKRYRGIIISRSIEVDHVNLHGFRRKSFYLRITINVDSNGNNLHDTSSVDTDETDTFIQKNIINNVYANNTNDTEVYRNGLALSKGFTTKISFANNRFAEDLRVYMNAYRPQGTDLRVYAKLHNSQDPETFDDKLWTPLRVVQNENVFSSATDINDLVEYEFGLDPYPASSNSLPGAFTTALSNNVIIANGVNPSTYVSANNLIKLYNPLILEDYMVVPVVSSNSTAIVLGAPVANNDLVGSGFAVDVMRDTGTAFLDATNGNVATYYTTTLNQVATFDSAQFKIVFLAESPNLVPEVDDFRAIGVNAGT